MEIWAILKSELKDASDQTLKDMDDVILLKGNDKRATSTPSLIINKKKEVMSMHGDIEDNPEIFQYFSKSTSVTKSELEMEI